VEELSCQGKIWYKLGACDALLPLPKSVSFVRNQMRKWLVAMSAFGLGQAVGVAAEDRLSSSVNNELPPVDAGTALARLKEGNRRFMAGESRHGHEGPSWRSLLVETQKPFATVIGCSDSRVPPELIFDVGFGDLFTIRLAGNIIAEDVMGSLQYGVAHLNTRLVVVLGHEGCGAVVATVEQLLHKTKELSHIESLIQLIRPGLRQLDLKQDRATLMRVAVEANVRWSMQQLYSTPEGTRALLEKRVRLVGGVYELATGRVRLLD
jgi:carbonic anhydrase